MSAAEWDEGCDPAQMLQAIRNIAEPAPLWEYVTRCLYGIGADAGVDVLQPLISGNLDAESLRALRHSLEVTATRRSGGGYSQGRKPVRMTEAAQRARATLAALQQSPWEAAAQVTQETRHQLQRFQCDWLRCLFSNPHRTPSLDPGWLTSTVSGLARMIIEEGIADRMPILADALMDAGCDNLDILQHCQKLEHHLRGCWVLDLILAEKSKVGRTRRGT
jgi:hypothetical protein